MSLVRLCSRTRIISARHLFFLFKGKLILLVKCPSLTLMRCSFNNCKTQTSRNTSKAPSQITSYAGVLKHLRGRLLSKVIYFIFIQAEWLGNPLDSFVIFFRSFFRPDRANVQRHSYHFELTDQSKHRINLLSHNS